MISETSTLSETLLQRFRDLLEEEGIPVHYEGKEEEHPVETLLIGLGKDKAGRGYTLQTFPIDDFVTLFPGFRDAANFQLIRFHSVLPFRVKPEAMEETGNLLFSLNRFLPLGSFGLGIEEAVITYDWTVPGRSNEAMATGLISLIRSLRSYLMSFLEVIESVSKGEVSHEIALEALANAYSLTLPALLPFPGVESPST